MVVIDFNLLLVSQLIKMMSIGADSLSFTTFTQRMGLARPSGAYLQVLGVDCCVEIRENRGVGVVAQEIAKGGAIVKGRRSFSRPSQ
jgi:hypothetical protein